MPYKKHKSVFKRLRQNLKRREYNRIVRGSLRAVMNAVRSEREPEYVLRRLSWSVEGKSATEKAQNIASRIYSIIDKSLKKGVIHKNKAARHKSQVAYWLNGILAQSASKPTK